MEDQKWENLINLVKEKFGIDSQRKELLEESPGEIEIIEFEGPLGKMKFERLTRPRVLAKKTHYSRRIGGNVKVDYIYSEDEFIKTFKMYKWNEEDDEWREISGGDFSL